MLDFGKDTKSPLELSSRCDKATTGIGDGDTLATDEADGGTRVAVGDGVITGDGDWENASHTGPTPHTDEPRTLPVLPTTAELTVEVPEPSENRTCSRSEETKGTEVVAAQSVPADARTSLALNARFQTRTSSMLVLLWGSL